MAAAEGAPALAELDLSYNELSEATKKQVRAALDARNMKLLAASKKKAKGNEHAPPLEGTLIYHV